MTIENLVKNYGTTNYNGKTYVLVQQAYIDGTFDAPYYCATAICPGYGVDEYGFYPVYGITWYPRQDWLESGDDDEGWACDWDNPASIDAICCGYDISGGRIV